MKRKAEVLDEEEAVDKSEETIKEAQEEKESRESANVKETHVEKKQKRDSFGKDSLHQEIKEKKSKDKEDKEFTGTSYVALDLETTGTNVLSDQIIQIGLIRFNLENETIIDEWQSLVKPSKPIPADAEAIHHFSNEDVADAPSFGSLAETISEFIGDSGLVGHNLIHFDLPCLQAEFRRCKLKEIDCSNRSLLDSLIIFQKKEPHTLSKAAKFYCDMDYDSKDAHNARNDAMACLRVLCAQKQRYPQLFQDMSKVEGLCKPPEFLELTDDGRDVIERKGKHKGKLASEIRKTDKGYWTWMVNLEKKNKTKWFKILQTIC